jgi:catechol 2,3-dioxygenase-like lactoylglutathione lyase family enzyme
MITSGIDHIALTVPNLNEQIDRFTNQFGMLVQSRTEHFALIVDPASGLKIELGRSADTEIHFRHLGFQAENVNQGCDHVNIVAHGSSKRPTPLRKSLLLTLREVLW